MGEMRCSRRALPALEKCHYASHFTVQRFKFLMLIFSLGVVTALPLEHTERRSLLLRPLVAQGDEAAELSMDFILPGDQQAQQSRPRSFLALLPDDSTSQAQAHTIAQSDQLSRQAGSAAFLAELLFGAAQPFAKLPGSTFALLPYFTRPVLMQYLSQPNRRSTALAAEMYDIAESVVLHAGHHNVLYRSLCDTFTWVAANTPTCVQHVPGVPWADVAWPSAVGGDLESVLLTALSDPSALGAVGDTLEAATHSRLSRAEYAALCSRLSDVLGALHLDLVNLMEVARRQHEADTQLQQHNSVSTAVQTSAASRRSGSSPRGMRLMQQLPANEATASASATHNNLLQSSSSSQQRRSNLARDLPNYDYSMPPNGFVPQPASELPSLLVPVAFHVMSYYDSAGDIGPMGYNNSAFAEQWMRITNLQAKPTHVQFFIQEVRNDPRVHPYLLLPSRDVWEGCFLIQDSPCTLPAFAEMALVGYPRVINVFIAGSRMAGYARSVPGMDTAGYLGYIWINWQITSPFYNSQAGFHYGSHMLTHELFHILGLEHSWGRTIEGGHTCNDDDGVHDTPTTLGGFSSANSSSILSTAYGYCLYLFYDRYNGSWENVYERWSTQLGIPEDDQRVWADTCPNSPGYDELGNYMSDMHSPCIAVLGHFTPGQVNRVYELTSQLNPIMYAWGQYYAQTMPTRPPSPPLPSAPPSLDACKTTNGGCRCKANWISPINGSPRSYCDTFPGRFQLGCEVEDTPSCRACAASVAANLTCYQPCPGTPQWCGKPAGAPAVSNSPRLPPFPAAPPPSPPTMPDDIPPECKVAKNGCPCRAAWGLGVLTSRPMHYCDYHDYFAPYLLCAVEPSCPDFDEVAPVVHCARNLTIEYCRGRPPAPPVVPPPPPRLPPPECRVVAANTTKGKCACLDTWSYGGQKYHYCASPSGSSTLMCEADPFNCPDYRGVFDAHYPCDERLTLEYCQGDGNSGGGSDGGHGGYGGYGGYGYGNGMLRSPSGLYVSHR